MKNLGENLRKDQFWSYLDWFFLLNLCHGKNYQIICMILELFQYLQHSGHSFKPLDEEYVVHKQKITDEINALRNRLMELDGENISRFKNIFYLKNYRLPTRDYYCFPSFAICTINFDESSRTCKKKRVSVQCPLSVHAPCAYMI